MAREYARLYVRVNNDREFAQLSPVEQWLFHRLTARQELSYAGVQPLAPKRWARMSSGVTVDEIDRAWRRLAEGQWLIVDEDTEEVLIRSLVRNDELAKQPNVLRAALRAAEFVESPTLRAALADELIRVRPGAKEWQRPELDRVVVDLAPNPSDDHAAPLPQTLPGSPSATPSPNPSQTPFAEGFDEPPVEVEVEVEVDVAAPSVGGWVGGRARPDRSSAGPRQGQSVEPPRVPPKSDRPSELCPTHRDGPPSNAPCRGCGRARAAAVEFDRRRDAAIRQCPMCDAEESLREVGRALPVSPRTRCDHVTDHRQQVADARDEAS